MSSLLRSSRFLLLGLFFASPLLAQEENLPVSGSEPVEITSDRLEYLKDEDQFIAEGSVEIIQGGVRLTADRAVLDNKSRWVTAWGQVDLFDGETRLTADRLKYNLDTGEGTLFQGTLFVEKDHFFLEAERIEKLPGDRYHVEKSSLTTCDFGKDKCPLWQFRASDIRLRVNGYLTARHVRFAIKGVPVFYLPYLIMPVKTTRQTGFLVPRVGYNTNEGLKVNEDFFWAIAANQDATFSLDYRSARGIGGGLEYRYLLSRESGGTLVARYFNDRIEERQRMEGGLQHRQVFSQDFQARLDLHLVSDIEQFRDLSEVTEDRVRKTLDSNFILYRRWNEQYLYLLARYTRDLLPSPNLTFQKKPVQKVPEIGYRLPAYPLGTLPLYFQLEATSTNFWVEEEVRSLELIQVRAHRLDVFPRIIGRFHISGLVITPRVGWRETWYSKGLNQDSPVRRSVGLLDARAHLRFWKTLLDSPERRLRHLVHSVEPDLVYEYVPALDQQNLPKFDAVDELPVKNLLTYSLTNRLVGRFKAQDQAVTHRRELAMLKLTQSYDIRERRRQGVQGPVRPLSNVRGEVAVRPFAATELDLDSFYNLYEKQIVTFNADLKTRFGPYLFLSVGQRMTREGTALPIGDSLNPLSQSNETFWYTTTEDDSPMIRFYTGYLRLDVPVGLSLASRAYYDAETRSFAEIDYQLQYDGQCWAFSVSYIDLPEENQITFLITLKTAGSTESRAFIDLFKYLP